MVVDAVIGSVVVVTPVIAPSQLSVAVGRVNDVNSHCAVSCGSEAESANGGSISCITTVMYSLQVTPLAVTSTQYSVVSVGVTEIVSVVSPVDQINDED